MMKNHIMNIECFCLLRNHNLKYCLLHGTFAACCSFLFEHAIHFGLGFLPYSYHKNETDLQLHRSNPENIFWLTGWTLIISLLCIRFNLGPAGWEPQIPAFVFQTFNDIDLAFSLCLHCATPVWIVISSSSTPQPILLHPYNWVSNGALLAGPVLREDIWSSL